MTAPGRNALILDQNALKSRYGWQGSAVMGCGWVAVYNALILLGVPVDPEDVRRDMEKTLWLGGFNGTPFFGLVLYFARRGFRIKLSVKRSDFGRLGRKSPAGILFYLYHQKGRPFPMGHFTAFSPTDDGLFHFYNDIPGKTDDIRSMRQFRKDKTAYFMLLMEIEK